MNVTTASRLLFRNGSLNPLRRGWFGFDDTAPHKGYTSGDTWNGWACPGFEWEEARAIFDNGELTTAPDPHNTWWGIDTENRVIDEHCDGDVTHDEGTIVQTEDGPKRLWFVGGWCCTWNDDSDRTCGHQRHDDGDQCTECDEV